MRSRWTTISAVLGWTLALHREAAGIGQTELGAVAGISQSAWSRMETGRSSVTVPVFVVVTKRLGVEPHVLLETVVRTVKALSAAGIAVVPNEQSAPPQGARRIGSDELPLSISLALGAKR